MYYIAKLFGYAQEAQPEGVLPNIIAKAYDLTGADVDGNGLIDNTEALKAVATSPYTYVAATGTAAAVGTGMYLNHKRKQKNAAEDQAPSSDEQAEKPSSPVPSIGKKTATGVII